MGTAVTTAKGRPSAEENLELWHEYKRAGDPRVRDRLVLTYAPMVKYIVYRKIREIPARSEVDDFISSGLGALIRSIDAYDPATGATLEEFAWTQIHGAVIDELRRRNSMPRAAGRLVRDIDNASDQFALLYGRRPTSTELSQSVAISVAELQRQAMGPGELLA
jgi:RNA polymerase sigma factor for flagellar operon FliA